jgi:nitrite reductase/ring-hydroxylating ferredoxin subunit/uncharacterized membrane protein
MLSHSINRFIDSQRWLDPLADPLQKITAAVYRGRLGRGVKSFFNGTWLGHPLHPVLTDIPLGAWTLAVIFDLIYLFSQRSPMARSAAEIMIGIGIVAALGAAVTGYTDWGDTVDRERRVGLSHGLLNLVATLLYVASLVLRLASPGQGVGIVLSWIGFVLLITAAYLGGELVYNIGTGVNHHAWQPPPTDWTRAMPASELVDGKPQVADCNGTPVFILKRGSQISAISETCSHAGGPLHEGTLEDGLVVCPWHASRFDLRTGAVKGGPATVSQVLYDVRIQEGRVEVRRSPATLQPN